MGTAPPAAPSGPINQGWWVHPQIGELLAWAFSEAAHPFVERKDGDE